MTKKRWFQLGHFPSQSQTSSHKIIFHSNKFLQTLIPSVLLKNKGRRPPAEVSITYGVASLQLTTARAAALGVSCVVFLHGEGCGRLGNRWRSFVEGWGWHQCWGETLAANIHRLRLLLQSGIGTKAKAQPWNANTALSFNQTINKSSNNVETEQ